MKKILCIALLFSINLVKSQTTTQLAVSESPEFKDEAVKLITERGYSVTDVAERLGVSQHSIYKWLKAVQPLRNNPDEHELLEAKKEILRLKSQLKQTEEERDILKKAARYFASLPE